MSLWLKVVVGLVCEIDNSHKTCFHSVKRFHILKANPVICICHSILWLNLTGNECATLQLWRGRGHGLCSRRAFISCTPQSLVHRLWGCLWPSPQPPMCLILADHEFQVGVGWVTLCVVQVMRWCGVTPFLQWVVTGIHYSSMVGTSPYDVWFFVLATLHTCTPWWKCV